MIEKKIKKLKYFEWFYLETTIQAKEEEYELGRRHLARMMGHSQDGVLSEKDVAVCFTIVFNIFFDFFYLIHI